MDSLELKKYADTFCTKERMSSKAKEKSRFMTFIGFIIVIIVIAWGIVQMQSTEYDPLFGGIQLVGGLIGLIIYTVIAIILVAILGLIVKSLIQKNITKDCQQNPLKYEPSNVSERKWRFNLFGRNKIRFS